MSSKTWRDRDVAVPSPRDSYAGMPMDPIRLWICATCGKVSQAQRKPKYHARRLLGLEDDGAGTPELTAKQRAERLKLQVLEVVLPGAADWENEVGMVEYFGGDPEDDLPPQLWQGEVTVACGPFEAWTAMKDQAGMEGDHA